MSRRGCQEDDIREEQTCKMKTRNVPLFKEHKRMGRPIKYDFTPFFKKSTKYIVFPNLTLKNYDSLRSTFARWRRREGVEGRFEYDILDATEKDPCGIAVWRSGES